MPSDQLRSVISLEPEGDDFALSITDTGGATTQVKLTGGHVLALAQAALGYRQMIMSRLHQGALFVAPVKEVRAGWDGFGKNLLLEMRFEPSGNTFFEVSPKTAAEIADDLRDLLKTGPTSRLARQ